MIFEQLENWMIDCWHGAWVKREGTRGPVGRISYYDSEREGYWIVWEPGKYHPFKSPSASVLSPEDIRVLKVSVDRWLPLVTRKQQDVQNVSSLVL